MKRILRSYLYTIISLVSADHVFGGSLDIEGGTKTFLFAGFILAVLNLLLRPILKLLFFPINAITMGLFTLVINMGIFYLFMALVEEVNLSLWTFPGLHISGIVLPETQFNFLVSLLAISVFVSIVSGFFAYLAD